MSNMILATRIAKITDIERRIKEGQNTLEWISRYIDDQINDNAGVEANWMGHVSESKINEAIRKIKSKNACCMREINRSLRTHNNNLQDITCLVKMLAVAEAEIFNRLSSASATLQDVDSFVVDWCKKQNVTDENLKEFIKLSVQHANKTASFNNEIKTLLSKIEERVNTIEQQVRGDCEELELLKSALMESIEPRGNISKTVFLKTSTESEKKLSVKKYIWETRWYKIGVGVVSVTALICSILF